jgi:TrmH family RNA methyltransferase
MAVDETLRSRANPLYKRLLALRRHASADGELCLVEGPKLVLEAVAAGVVLVEAAFAPRAVATEPGRAALAALVAQGVPARAMSPQLIASLSETETSQGLVALGRRPAFEEAAILRGTPLVLVADAVQNPGNLGGLLRTAEAAGATGAYLTGACADPLSWKALRGSMGSAFRLPHARGLALEAVVERLLARGIAVLATAADGERRYDEVDLRGPSAILVGAEGAGLPAGVQARASARLRVPLAPPVESLNVGVAAALVFFEAARQRGFAPRVPER